MGALIVVLVALNRHSRLQAAALSNSEIEARKATAVEAQVQTELLRETAVWRLEHLRTSREKTQADLDRERLRLSSVEEHRRQLEAELSKLQREAAQLEDSASSVSPPFDSEDLAKLNAQIEAARQRLAETRRRAGDRAPAYSVVSYDGANRTRRRPIYIECLQDRVIIQPEGIVLLAADFDGPPGPGNPLASAVRAARDHLVAMAADPRSPDAEPYPLFLVRPDGIEAYYAARGAMQSWGSDFGYQTLDRDWTLEFPPVDARLAELERQAVEEARDRRRWLAQMSPNRFGDEHNGAGGKVRYHVSPMGGLVREGGPTLRDNRGGMTRIEPNARGGSGPKGGRQSIDKSVIGKSSVAGDHPVGREMPSRRNNRSDGQGARGATDSETVADHPAIAKSAERRYGDLNQRATPRDKSNESGSQGAQGSAHTDPDTGQTEMNTQLTAQAKARPRSLAETRGVNWGLSPAARASNPITRPIHIVCEGSQLLVRAERPGDAPVKVALTLRTEDSVDPLVAAIHERINDWGIAGRGLYWRPQLILAVGHSGEGRFADLEALLADSGFDVKRR
jgi:hypothetical protein